MRRFTHAIALLAAGAAAYYAAPVAIRLLEPRPARELEPLVAIETPEGATDQSGDVVLLNCLADLERHQTVEAELVQSGYLLNQSIEVAGIYRQKGRAENRRFALLMQGRIADKPLRLWQVSSSSHLYTDLAWGPSPGAVSAGSAVPTSQRRDVTQIDLREVRQELAPNRDYGSAAIGVGEAAASSVNPMLSAAQGGLPMLVESLGANFHFGAPRKMGLHNQHVFVMIGHWKPQAFAALAGPDSALDPETVKRLPNHVLLALGARDRFPYLIEYRAAEDPLSAPGLTDDARIRQSGRPLLRMEFRRPQFNLELADAEFEYPEAGSVDRRDVTDVRVANLLRRQRLKIAARSEGLVAPR